MPQGIFGAIGSAVLGVPGQVAGSVIDRKVLQSIFQKQAASLKAQGKDLNDPSVKNELYAKTTLLAKPENVPSPSGERFQLTPTTGQPSIPLGTDPTTRAQGLLNTQNYFQGKISETEKSVDAAFEDYKTAAKYNETDFLNNLRSKIQGTDDLDQKVSDINQKIYELRPALLKKYENILDPDKKEALIRAEENILQDEAVQIAKLKVDRTGTIDEIIKSAKEEKADEVESFKLAYEKAKDDANRAISQYEKGVGNYKDVISAADAARKLESELQRANDELGEFAPTLTTSDRNQGVAQGQRWLDRSIMRTDRHNNPTAIKWYPQFVDMLKRAGLQEGVDFWKGDDTFGIDTDSVPTIAFKDVDTGVQGNIAVIDQIGFYTGAGGKRWQHTAYTPQQWASFTPEQKSQVISQMYQREGGKGNFQPLQSPESSSEPAGIFDKIAGIFGGGEKSEKKKDLQKQKDMTEIIIIANKIGGTAEETKVLKRQLQNLYEQGVTMEEIKKIANTLKEKSGGGLDELLKKTENPDTAASDTGEENSFFEL